MVRREIFLSDGSLGEIADKIGAGHAFEKHVLERGEFKPFGIETRAQLQGFVGRIMRNAKTSEIKRLSLLRSAYWDESTGTIVIHDMSHPDQGTVFRPKAGRAYFDALKTEP